MRVAGRAASRHWQRVCELTRERAGDPEAAGLAMRGCTWLLSTGWRMGITPEEVDALAAEGRRWAEHSGDVEALVRLESSVHSFHMTGGHMEGAREHGLAAERVAESSGDPRLRAMGRYSLLYYWFTVGPIDVAIERGDELIAYADRIARVTRAGGARRGTRARARHRPRGRSMAPERAGGGLSRNG